MWCCEWIKEEEEESNEEENGKHVERCISKGPKEMHKENETRENISILW